jgi:putative SOS response-associated peptidase YedK
MINARSETVAEKPSFREAFKKRRCLILADGFYEWMQQEGKKQPVFITLPGEAGHLVMAVFVKGSNKSHGRIERTIAALARAAYDYWTSPARTVPAAG